jgi:hypothetical protein
VKLSPRYLIVVSALVLIPVNVVGGVITAPLASADCVDAGGSTVCAQGTVRGGGPTPPQAGPYYPSACYDPWYCDNGWNIDLDIDRPNRPGGGGGRPGGGGGHGGGGGRN